MSEANDGIDEAFEGQLRVLVTAAGQVAERLSRSRESELRRAEAGSEQEARELQSRLEAENQVARAQAGAVHRSEWWDTATPEQIGDTYQVARAWANEDPELARAEQRIREELRTRYGVDVAGTNADSGAVREAIARAEQRRVRAEAERQGARADSAEAQRLMAVANTADRLPERAAVVGDEAERQAQAEAARTASEPLYDSAERRTTTAADLEAHGVGPELVATRMRADVSQAKPATETTRGAGGKAPKARKSRGRGSQVQRTGLER
ncbi:hypothetical protein [Occultella glacieicola]|uniref:hypothetical protein n=1 Tax=Occultella glacieicola TaxID=2518684 RepID=UPI001404FE01|nr:hypothetical protein [Occultella glacieicola]